MRINKILIPYSFSMLDRKALTFAARMFGPLTETAVTLYYAYIPVPQIESIASPVMERMKSNMHYLSQRIQEEEADLQKAKHELVSLGIAEQRVSCAFMPKRRDIASDIIDFVRKENYDTLVMSQTPGRATRLLKGSIVNRIVASLADKTICIVT